MHQIFSYFGSKKRIASKYPNPQQGVIIEPFCGAAGYSVHHEPSKAILFDVDESVCAVWRFVIQAGKMGGDPIRDLPLLEVGDSVPDIEGKELIGFWCRRGSESPRYKLNGSWAEQYPQRFWGEYQRERLARDSVKCADWEIHNSDYSVSDGLVGSWFIDPPYQLAGKHYKHPFKNYNDLALFCKRQSHSVIVCEEVSNDHYPDWLPFMRVPWVHLTSQNRAAKELVWTKDMM